MKVSSAVLPVFSSHPYFQLSVIESWLNIVNCIVNRTILFAPRQITISHYRILIDHKSLIPSPPVIIKFIFNLIKGMYWIITVALIVSGLKTCFLKSWLVRQSCNSEFVIVKWGESCGHKWTGFQKLFSGCTVCGCTWQLVNLLLLAVNCTCSPTFPVSISVGTSTYCSVCYALPYSTYSWRIKVSLVAVRKFTSSAQIVEILSGLKVSGSVPRMSSYTCKIAGMETKSWLKPEWEPFSFYLSPNFFPPH